MSSTKKIPTQKAPPTEEILQSIARSINLLVRLKAKELQGDRKLKDMILWLHSLGWRPAEIAEALGKTDNDVNPVISRARIGRGMGKKRVRKGLPK
jgi:DNA-directed RNA polymerase specialized sigma24 family protein